MGALIPEPQLAPFKELLLRTCGFGFANDRERTLQEGLEQRMGLRGAASPADYLAALGDDPAELARLVELLTVNETYFLREPAHLDLLVDKLVPERRAAHPGPVRILCAGCSTGEEPYSVAMLLQDRTGLAGLAITGVDIDSIAIAKAREASYGRHSFRGMDRDFEARHFEASGPQEMRVKEAVRTRVAFGELNLLSPDYPPELDQQDIILYRNVSIYFPGPVQEAIFRRLAALLKPGGYLLVGATETLFHDLGILSLIERDSLYLFKKEAAFGIQDRRMTRRPPERPLTPPVRPFTPAARRPAPAEPGLKRARNLFDDALECARTRREAQALAILDTLLEGEPGHVKAHSLKASLLMAGARHGEALAVCEAALGLDPLCLEACLMLGILARQTGDDLAALKRFREAIYLEASCWFAHYSQAEIHLAKGDRSRARTGFEAALRILVAGVYHQGFFPLSFNAEEFIMLCRHKLALLQKT
jgi:chemotaxis protein methyltransferase CheR